MVRYSIVRCGMVWCCMVGCSIMVWFGGMVLCGIVWYGRVRSDKVAHWLVGSVYMLQSPPFPLPEY